MMIVDRDPVVAGIFYKKEKEALKLQLEELFKDYEIETSGKVAALIVPHAGYVYSGKVAARAYASLNKDVSYKNVFIIGSSHHVSLRGASIYNKGNYRTPLGMVKVNLEIANEIISSSKYFEFSKEAHEQEHTIEVQLPFLQFWMNDVNQIVPIVVGTHSADVCKEIAKVLNPYFNEQNLFVISTDFSHYPSDEDARRIDSITKEAICSNDVNVLLRSLEKVKDKCDSKLLTALCGWSSVLTLHYITGGKKEYTYQPLMYMNSSESVCHDKSRVVGYQSILVSRSEDKEFYLSKKEKKYLLEIARKSIYKFCKAEIKETDIGEFKFEMYSSVFVSVYVLEDLRGCIGYFDDNRGLEVLIEELSISAAFKDSRFKPVEFDELEDVRIEISVLTPKRKIESIDEIELGKHGVWIKKDWRSGTFLPQVATKTKWSKEEFLGHLARDKAHIGWDGWKDAELYTYEAIVFSDK